jgi:ABC-2 type transport system permease protein
MGGFAATLRRQLRVNRTSLIVMTWLMTVFDVVQVQAYQSAFPNPATRDALLNAFASNSGLRALYGYPFDISNATGWVAWRNMSTIAVIMAMWAAIIVSGASRGEEEAGRAELSLSQPLSRRRWFGAGLAAVAIETLVIGAISLAGMAAVGIPQGLLTVSGCLELTLQLVLPALLFAAVGALMSQLFGTARSARIGTAAILVVAFLLRTAADTGSGIAWVRWLSPLGWFEELHPPAAPSLAALAAIVVSIVVLIAVSMRLLRDRDINIGLLPHSDSRPPRRWLLGAPWQAALRDELPQLSMWLVATLTTVALMGGLTKTVLDFLHGDSSLSALLGSSFGVNSFVTAIFSLVQLVVALLAVTLMVDARAEESSGRLELLVAEPLSRERWLVSRALLAGGAALLLAVIASLTMWAAAGAAGQTLDLGRMAEAALNCLPIIAVTVGLAAAVLAVAPRAVAFTYAAVAVAYLWDALGTVLGAPAWLLDASPFHALARLPLEAFAVVPALVVVAVGLVLTAAAVSRFARRDLVGA